MALHFGKREFDQPRPLNSGMATPRNGAPTGAAAPAGNGSIGAPEVPATAAAPNTAGAPASATPLAPEGGAKLIVGPNIKLKGVEITDCDTLFVEGMVEATMDSRVIQIAEQGAFKGSAGVDIAEVHGTIEGELTVRQKLVIHATGRVTGRIRYGRLVIEEGGQISGDVECAGAAPKAGAAAKPPSMALAA